MDGDTRKRLPRAVDYYMPGVGAAITIPAGTPVIEATNLPEGSIIKYWAEPWLGMSEEASAHMRTYGFGLRQEELEEDDAIAPEAGAEAPGSEIAE